MTLRTRLRLISLLQVVDGVLYVLSGMFVVSHAASLSREEAILRGHPDVPAEFARVFINHGAVHNWPFGKVHFVLGCIVFVATLSFLFGSVWVVRHLKSRHV